MGNLGTAIGGVQLVLGGTQSLTPSDAENAIAAAAGDLFSTAVALPGDVAHDAAAAVGNPGAVQVFEGTGQVAAAVAEVAASDGALAPLAWAQAIGGVVQIAGGVAQLVGGTAPGSGLTSTQAGQLAGVYGQVGTAGNLATSMGVVAEQVWDYSTLIGGVNCLQAITAAYRDHVGLGKMHAVVAFPYPYVPGVWAVLNGQEETDWDEFTPFFPAWDPADINPGELPSQAFIRQNPGYATVTWAPYELLVSPGNGLLLFVGQQYGLDSYGLPGNPGLQEWGVDYATYRMYTPSSGPPTRLLLADQAMLFALIPVKYS